MPPPHTISGTPLPVSRKWKYHWERGVGWRTIARFIGTEQSAGGLLTDLELNWDRIDVTPDDNSALVEIEASVNEIDEGGAEVAETTWELIPNAVEKDIFLHPAVQALGKGWIKFIKLALQDPEAAVFATADPADPDPRPAAAAAIYDLINAGFRAFPQDIPTLRLTQTVSNRYSLRLSQSYVGQVIAPGSIVSLEEIPADVMFALPGDPYTVPEFRWGWLKKMPSTRRTAFGKFSMTQDWQYGHYPTRFFTFYPPP